MDDLVEFLRARVAEDEEAARAATSGPWWHHPGKQWLGPEAFEKYDLRQGEEFVGYGGPHPFTGAVCSTGPASNMQGMKDAAHIARHDPARVLREIDAKRRLLSLHARAHHQCVTEDGPTQWHASDPCTTQRLLALPYSDHPDHRPEWATE